ncbi:AAA family ATPase [Candidatus Daviesbacteria bacterium]|nr:AAA family ATPase [Candidatus Daviesbacteria bacterium]
MKYLLIPLHFIEFWYLEGSAFFIRSWKNLMLFVEEDLAVGLMIKLLFTPLFHDSTIVGLVLSFLFRFSRILMGLFAFTLSSIALLGIAVYWFGLPILAVLNTPHLISAGLFSAGLGLFLIHTTTHPHKKVWQIKGSILDFWLASTITKEKINFVNLLKDRQVLDLLSNLELQPDYFFNWQITNIEETGQKAFKLAKNYGSQYIEPQHFFVAALESIPGIDDLLLKVDLKLSDFEQVLDFLQKKRQIWRRVYVWDDDFTIHHLKGVNRGWLGVPTPTLDLYGEDLTRKAAKEGFPEMIREKGIITDVVNILSQASGRNVILVGPPGSGKTALIKHMARQIVAGDAPASLATKRLVLLDLTKLLSGVKTQGELAERVKAIFEEVSFAQNVIIVIEEIHELGMGEVGSSFNLYSLMQPYLEEDNFQFIGTTESDSYSHILEKNGSFARIFRKVELEPATALDTLNILEYRAIEAERKNKVKVTFVAMTAAIELSAKFIRERVLPDSAISILKESLTESVNGWVTKKVVKRVISSRVKVPLMDVAAVDKNKLLNLEEELHLRLVDQEEAVKSVADTLRRAATGLNEEGRPIGSFLFVGPTGVGKTELAKALAATYFKTEGAFIRFDMSEYQNPESVVRLIGGQGEGGLLTESVRNRPYALLLLDEFEKANDKILTLFLQVLDDGRLTDGAGRTISFENTIIIATSNAGSLLIAQGLQQGKGMEVIDRQVNDELLKVFKPELVNRFDDVVIFKPLSQTDLEKIVKLKLDKLQNQLKVKGYLVDFNPDLITELARRGFDPVLGARPLRRLMQDTLEAKFSKLILQNQLIKGQTFQAGVELLG